MNHVKCQKARACGSHFFAADAGDFNQPWFAVAGGETHTEMQGVGDASAPARATGQAQRAGEGAAKGRAAGGPGMAGALLSPAPGFGTIASRLEHAEHGSGTGSVNVGASRGMGRGPSHHQRPGALDSHGGTGAAAAAGTYSEQHSDDELPRWNIARRGPAPAGNHAAPQPQAGRGIARGGGAVAAGRGTRLSAAAAVGGSLSLADWRAPAGNQRGTAAAPRRAAPLAADAGASAQDGGAEYISLSGSPSAAGDSDSELEVQYGALPWGASALPYTYAGAADALAARGEAQGTSGAAPGVPAGGENVYRSVHARKEDADEFSEDCAPPPQDPGAVRVTGTDDGIVRFIPPPPPPTNGTAPAAQPVEIGIICNNLRARFFPDRQARSERSPESMFAACEADFFVVMEQGHPSILRSPPASLVVTCPAHSA